MSIKRVGILGCGGLLLALGCARSPQVRYYTLAIPVAAERAGAAQAAVPPRVVGVGPVALADYLNQPYVTVRDGAHALVRSEVERWGGSFRDTVTRASAAHLAGAFGGENVVALPWSDAATVDFRLHLSLDRFERSADAVVLQGVWFLTAAGKRGTVCSGALQVAEPTAGADTAATVAAMSRALEAACAAMAAELRPVLLRAP